MDSVWELDYLLSHDLVFFFSSRRRHTRYWRDWSSDVCSSDLVARSWRGIAVGCGINPWYGEIDPYAMALLAVDEALRNVVAVGADPARTAILDNFCWGNPQLPDRLGGLVRAARGCHDAAVALRVPFISGKDSLFNEYRLADGSSRPIPGTLLISAIGIVPNTRRVTSMHLKRPGNLVYLVGVTDDDLEIGRASCRERVYISVVAVSL